MYSLPWTNSGPTAHKTHAHPRTFSKKARSYSGIMVFIKWEMTVRLRTLATQLRLRHIFICMDRLGVSGTTRTRCDRRRTIGRCRRTYVSLRDSDGYAHTHASLTPAMPPEAQRQVPGFTTGRLPHRYPHGSHRDARNCSQVLY